MSVRQKYLFALRRNHQFLCAVAEIAVSRDKVRGDIGELSAYPFCVFRVVARVQNHIDADNAVYYIKTQTAIPVGIGKNKNTQSKVPLFRKAMAILTFFAKNVQEKRTFVNKMYY